MAEMHTFGVVHIATELKLQPVNDTNVINFSGKTIERIKNKNTQEYESTPHYFAFEIWDSAAVYLFEHAQKGDKIVIHNATPREHKWTKEENGVVKNYSKTVFRVNKFELCSSPQFKEENV